MKITMLFIDIQILILIVSFYKGIKTYNSFLLFDLSYSVYKNRTRHLIPSIRVD